MKQRSYRGISQALETPFGKSRVYILVVADRDAFPDLEVFAAGARDMVASLADGLEADQVGSGEAAAGSLKIRHEAPRGSQ